MLYASKAPDESGNYYHSAPVTYRLGISAIMPTDALELLEVVPQGSALIPNLQHSGFQQFL